MSICIYLYRLVTQPSICISLRGVKRIELYPRTRILHARIVTLELFLPIVQATGLRQNEKKVREHRDKKIKKKKLT